jgi:hypothetical protein
MAVCFKVHATLELVIVLLDSPGAFEKSTLLCDYNTHRTYKIPVTKIPGRIFIGALKK